MNDQTAINNTHGSEHSLYIGDGDVLSIVLDKNSRDFPPRAAICDQLDDMIRGLAVAAKAVAYRAENDSKFDCEAAMQPIEGISNAIILLSQLSSAIKAEAES